VFGHPQFTLNNIYKLEKVQRKGARFLCNNFSMHSSVTAMLNKLNWASLKDRRDNLRLLMMHKIVNNLVEIDSYSSLIRTDTPTRGHSKRFKQLISRINSFKFSFYPDTIKLWNRLPEHIVNCTTIHSFN